MESKGLDDNFAHAQDDLNLCILCIFNGTFSLDVAYFILQGMSYLAEKSILHCDLTAANVLLSHDLTAKISDLGFSKLLEQGQSKTESGFYKRENAKFKLLW